MVWTSSSRHVPAWKAWGLLPLLFDTLVIHCVTVSEILRKTFRKFIGGHTTIFSLLAIEWKPQTLSKKHQIEVYAILNLSLSFVDIKSSRYGSIGKGHAVLLSRSYRSRPFLTCRWDIKVVAYDHFSVCFRKYESWLKRSCVWMKYNFCYSPALHSNNQVLPFTHGLDVPSTKNSLPNAILKTSQLGR